MITLQIHIPDDLAARAREAGLLSSEALIEMIEGALRREAGRVLLDHMKRIHEADLPPISEEEIVAEVRAVRKELAAERRARES